MPAPLYFHPFVTRRHYIGFGPHMVSDLPSWVSLHGVAPHITKVHHRYLWKMGGLRGKTMTFAPYVAATDPIYVMGHGSPGSHVLSTEVDGNVETCSTTRLEKLLRNHGLHINSQVHIRVHSCNSASAGGGTSFAQDLKARLMASGYNNVTVRGYDCAVGVYLGVRWAGLLPADLYAHDF